MYLASRPLSPNPLFLRYIWDYVTDFNAYILPFPNWSVFLLLNKFRCRGVLGFATHTAPFAKRYVLGPNMRYFLANGVEGIFEESNYNAYGADMAELKKCGTRTKHNALHDFHMHTACLFSVRVRCAAMSWAGCCGTRRSRTWTLSTNS